MITFDRFKNGAVGAVTLSYDDGQQFDRRLVALMNESGLHGTFNLNSSRFGRVGDEYFVEKDELTELYRGHEVAVHGLNHPNLVKMPIAECTRQVLLDRDSLEKLVGYPVRGMAYPYGAYSEEVKDSLRRCGIVYSRTAEDSHSFTPPRDFLQWHPTCHHRECLEMAQRFLENMQSPYSKGNLLYVWGHSFEFDRNNNWEIIERFCDVISGKDYLWYATNIEIYDYLAAQRSLRVTVDGSVIENPSAIDVWVAKDGEAVRIAAGATVRL